MTSDRFSILILSVIVFSFFVVLFIYRHNHYDSIHEDIFRAMINLISIGVFAQVASSILQNSNIQRQNLKERDDEIIAQIRSLTRIYSEVKKIRRISRAYSVKETGLTRSYILEVRYYRDFMLKLNDAQISCEVLEKELQIQSGIKKIREIRKDISRMEKYLNRIVDEFEENRIRITDDNDKHPIKLASLPCFLDLLGDYKSSLFRAEFVHTYHRARTIMRDIRINS